MDSNDQCLIIDNKSIKRFVLDCLQVLRKLRCIKLDAVIDCELFSRISSIFSFLSGADLRVGFHPYTQEGLYRGSFIDRPVMYNPYNHISEQFLTMVKALDSNTVPTAKQVVSGRFREAPSISFKETASRLLLPPVEKIPFGWICRCCHWYGSR